MTLSPFLKRVLILDSASCISMGLLLSLGAGALTALFGIDRAIVSGAGLALFPVGLFMLWLGLRPAAPAALVYLVIAGNVVWTVESFLLAANSTSITALGTAFVTAQALAVAGLTLLEWVGVRRSRAAAA